MWCCRIPFVNLHVRRRSLSAIRYTAALTMKTHRTLAFAAMAAALAVPARGQQTGCDRPLVVDLRARTVAGVLMDTPPAQLVQLLGSARVTIDTAYPEGHPSAVYDIDFCGHTVRRHSNAVSWVDSTFRTPENLGVGSQIRDFDRHYGEGQGMWGEGPAVRYTAPGARSHFFLDAGGQCFAPQPGKVVVDRSCRVTRISFIVLAK
jgi:hypothetical protein